MHGRRTVVITRRSRRCSNCDEDLPLEEFWRNSSRPDGLQEWCKTCFGEAYRHRRRSLGFEVRERMPIPDGYKRCPKCSRVLNHTEFHIARSQSDGLAAHCKACRSRTQREKREEALYGLSPKAAGELREAFPVCPICRTDEARHIDHDHATGAVRGRLCFRCNAALGQLRDDPEIVRRAAAYLEGDVWRPTGTTPVDSRLPS